MQFLAIDLGKQSFHIHGITDEGEVISRKVSRSKLEASVQELSPGAIAIEACASAHHWGRCFEAMGYPVRLIHPEPLRVRRRQFRLSQAAMLSSSRLA
jgi:transposase